MENIPLKGNIKSLKQIRNYLKPYHLQIAAALVALVFTSSMVLGMGAAMKYLIDEGISKKDSHLLDQSFVIFITLTVALAIATYTRYYLVSYVGEKVVADIRRDVYANVIGLHTGFFESTRTGDLISRITTDTTLLQTVVGSSVSVALRNGLMFIGGSIMMLHTSPRLTGYVAIIVPLVVFPIVIIGKRVRRLSKAAQSRVADISAHAEETISGIRTIQAFALEKQEMEKFNVQVNLSLKTALKRIRVRAALTAIVITFVFGAIVTVLWIGGHDVMTGRLSSGELSAFIFYSVVVAGSVGAISEVIGELQRAAGATERLMELLAMVSDIKDSEMPLFIAPPVKGIISIKNLTFYYPSRPDRKAADDLNLEIAAGETIALVGPSGAGKSTIFQLLLRFYDPGMGCITIDGVDIRQIKLADLRSYIGLVPQDPVIFSANAWENIRAGKTDASTKEILEAVAGAAASDFLEKLPDGLDTYLGEKGVRLSGGQKQRIAIARAIVRNPRILLLDEATSALDSENEQKIQQAFANLMKNRTTIVIAHRLATVLKADRIVVINEGKIEAIGKHTELLETSPLYARLAELQFKNS